ncbi:GDSL esterase/lipase At4g10955-like [Camellia sinensis]|uniref:GDSL esterase/lipase At4g10955-like n=1 Tax=Camellia sinensis TaxID=4442 RepID=UPI0010363B05|nr:GDSL esterase/lipase At4g10955-like [Camellia sinensis]
MASEREIFSLSGPVYLTVHDWRNPHHRRSVAASLVQGVYILECDRQQNRQGHQALAPPWWSFFHFQLIRELVDDVDHSIFGAIYKFKFPPYCNYFVQNPPRYVVAFRGTIMKPDTWLQDLKLDRKVIQNSLQQSTRFQVAMQAVQDMVAIAGAANIWLAGHSLGSAIALLAGKNMVKIGCFVETYLFNPPFPSALIEEIKNEKLKHRIRFTNSVVTAGIAVAVNCHHQSPQKDDSFSVLSGWIPYLFVNPSDPICYEYIWYFEHRLKMMKFCDGSLGRLATQNSVGSLLSGSEPAHLIPSAYLTINLSPSEGFKKAHEIHQWWKPNMQCEFKLHQFK